VHLWRANLDEVPRATLTVLDHAERARARSILSALRRVRWMHARAVLKTLLGHYLDVHPREVHLELDARGKPVLAQRTSAKASSCATSLCFSVTHSRSLGLYAFADALPVGVDIEIERPLPAARLASRAFGAHEGARLARMPRPLRQREFLQAWTEHEARLKCAGGGIGAPRVGHERQGDLREPTIPSPWTVALDARPHAVAALAAATAPSAIHCWEWAPRRLHPDACRAQPQPVS
jgi:phosphopantetheinyl transferase